VLGDYASTVLCDGYAAYEALKKRGGRFQLAHCWAHVRRKFVEAEEVSPGPCAEVLDLIAQLYAVERDCSTDEERSLARRDRSHELIRQIQAWALKQRALPQSPFCKAIG
jgi:transposase